MAAKKTVKKTKPAAQKAQKPVKKAKAPAKKPVKVKAMKPKAVKKVAKPKLKVVKKSAKKIVKKAAPQKKPVKSKALKKALAKKTGKAVKPAKKAQKPEKTVPAKKTAPKKVAADVKKQPEPKKDVVKKEFSTSPQVTKAIAPMSTPPKDETASFSQEVEEVLLTEEGLKTLKEELGYLKDVRRKEVAQRLKEAISYGDLSENSEYEEAKNEQAFVEGRILELEKKIKHAKIIKGKSSSVAVVRIGSTVEIKEIKSGRKETYTIVGATEADPFAGRISNESPVGKAIIGKKKGDRVTVVAPGGNFDYEIISLA